MAKDRIPDILTDVLDYEGKPGEADRQARMNYYLPAALIRRVKAFGKRRHWSASLVVREALEAYLEKHGG